MWYRYMIQGGQKYYVDNNVVRRSMQMINMVQCEEKIVIE